MQLKSYEATSIQEALEMIKRDLGADAVVLSTSRRGKMVEVVAARDEATPPASPLRMAYGGEEAWGTREALALLCDLLGHQGRVVPDDWAPLYERLVSAGVSRALACQITERLRKMHCHDVAAVLGTMITVTDFKKRIRVLVGPTGAGKTTTLAKLAAISTYSRGERTAIITTDTYRIAATDQIRIYARIMNVPMVVASDREAFQRALERFSDREVIYVDTPGQSPGNREAISILAGIIGDLPDMEACLVLALTSQREHLLFSARQYGLVGPTSVIFTKLDEGPRCGAMCDVAAATGMPISWWTTGQSVPEDIEPATLSGVVELIMGGNRWIRQPC